MILNSSDRVSYLIPSVRAKPTPGSEMGVHPQLHASLVGLFPVQLTHCSSTCAIQNFHMRRGPAVLSRENIVEATVLSPVRSSSI